jgi:uncharacterized SAM-binding protein YcdF (DUF218 family)
MMDWVYMNLTLLADPTALGWLGVVVLAVWLARRRQRGPALFAATVAIVVFIGGATDFPGWLLRRMERPWAGKNIEALPACDAIVVLGGGATPSRFEAGRVRFTRSMDRIAMGIHLARSNKARVLVIGGGGGELDGVLQCEADLVMERLKFWGVTQSPPEFEIVSLGINANTHDEAVKVAALCKDRNWKRVLLVTSAFHMSRAVATFQTAGVNVEPVPCNFLTSLSVDPGRQGVFLPTGAGGEKMMTVIHEKGGWWIYKRRGWIRD